MASHRELKVWQLSHALAVRIYRETRGPVRGKSPHKIDQLRRSAESIPSNIAEGYGQSKAQFRRYLKIASGSASESDNHVEFLRDTEVLDPALALALRDDLAVIHRMLLALHKSKE